MANYKTGAQRYNDRMDKIFRKSEELGNHTLHGSSEKRKAITKKMSVKGAEKEAFKIYHKTKTSNWPYRYPKDNKETKKGRVAEDKHAMAKKMHGK